MKKEMVCVVCPVSCRMNVDINEAGDIFVSGNKCKRGVTYAELELTHPTRKVSSTVKIDKGIHMRLPVKSDTEVPKALLLDIVKALDDVMITAPVRIGDVVAKDVLGSGINFIATRSM
jgi:CxxC motif-containing protein